MPSGFLPRGTLTVMLSFKPPQNDSRQGLGDGNVELTLENTDGARRKFRYTGSCPPHTFAHGLLPLRAEGGARRRLERLSVAHFVYEPFTDEADPGVAWVS